MKIRSLPTLGAALAALSLAGPLPALALDGTLAKIAETGRITLGHRDAAVPFSYLDGDAQPVGFSMDLCRAVVEAVRERLELPELETGDLTVTSQTRIPLLANGTIDLEWGSTTNTLERQRQVAYGPTMVLAAGRFLVRADAGIEGPGDLAGRTVPAMQGSNPVQVLTRLNEERDLGPRMLPAKDFADSFLLLQTGRADASPRTTSSWPGCAPPPAIRRPTGLSARPSQSSPTASCCAGTTPPSRRWSTRPSPG